MKRFVVLFVAVFVFPALAQEAALIDDNVENGGFGGPVFKLTNVNGTTALMTGGTGGWIINHSFIVGAAGYGLVTDVNAKVTDSVNQYLEMRYGGLELQYVLLPNRLLHVSAGLLVGGGGIAYRDDDAFRPSHLSFFVLEPTVNAQLNVTRFFRVAAGVSYRYVRGLKSDLSTNADLSAPSALLMLQFGKF